MIVDAVGEELKDWILVSDILEVVMKNDRAVYCSEEDRWYRLGDDPWRVRDIPADRKVTPIFSVVADTYAQAFELLFGRPFTYPVPVRTPRHLVHVSAV